MQKQMGFIDPEMTTGFEGSVISTISSGGGAEWWKGAKPAYSSAFVAYIDEKLRAENHKPLHTGSVEPAQARNFSSDATQTHEGE